uniref:Uncharacterized protein n=1 Tax=Parascaris equorum TaxID=6256 RepID=A0A914RIN7_PAREQ
MNWKDIGEAKEVALKQALSAALSSAKLLEVLDVHFTKAKSLMKYTSVNRHQIIFLTAYFPQEIQPADLGMFLTRSGAEHFPCLSVVCS